MEYFSDRERGPVGRTVEEITPEAWRGIWALVSTRVENGSFGGAFPVQCPDERGVIGGDAQLLEAAAHGDGILWPIRRDEVPDTLAVMDLLEFCHRYVAEPVSVGYHDYFGHHHLGFRVEEG